MFLDYLLPYLYAMKNWLPTGGRTSESPTNAVQSSRTAAGPREQATADHTEPLPVDAQHLSVDAEPLLVDAESLRVALQDKEREIEKWKKSAQDAAERARSCEDALAEADQSHHAERIAFDQQLAAAKRRVYAAEYRIKDLEDAVTQIRRQSQDELQKTTVLLDTRTAELRDAQAYLTALDDVADTEVLHLVEGINSRIFQAAASIADAFRSRYGEQKDRRDPIVLSPEAGARVQRLLGDDLLRALSSIDHSNDSLVVQTALQAVMVSYTKWLCATWDFDFADPKQVLQNVYSFIRRTEQQSVAGRWRAISRTYVKMFLADEQKRQQTASDTLLQHIMDILLLSGIAVEPQDLRTEVERSHADGLREVVRQSLEFQRITGEGIISRDLLIVATKLGEPFDPSRMVDEWADPKGVDDHNVNPHPVLCTTQLGLVREERKATESAGGEEEIVAVVLLKPKVVLTSLLEELWNEEVQDTRKS